MTQEEFNRVYPAIRAWIEQALAANAKGTRSVLSLSFPRLNRYFSSQLLQDSKVVLVDRCPMPPLSALGLNQFDAFEVMQPAGITYGDTYFVVANEARRESLHFHELIHVIQWRLLGMERFVAHYADGLEKHGYRNSPLEVMAYDHEARFSNDQRPYDVEAAIRNQLK